MRRLGEIGSSETPCNILTLDTGIKKWVGGNFKVLIMRAEYAKNVFGGHFPTEYNGVTD